VSFDSMTRLKNGQLRFYGSDPARRPALERLGTGLRSFRLSPERVGWTIRKNAVNLLSSSLKVNKIELAKTVIPMLRILTWPGSDSQG
jgi:hypothetical protein